jgi:hypothetical protein
VRVKAVHRTLMKSTPGDTSQCLSTRVSLVSSEFVAKYFSRLYIKGFNENITFTIV